MKQIINSICFLILLVSVFSCTSEEHLNDTIQTSMENSISINYKINKELNTSTTDQTEAGDLYNDLNENELKNISIFFFNEKEELDWAVEASSFFLADNKIHIRIPHDKSIRYENQNFTVVVIANANSKLAQIETIPALKQNILTYEDLNMPNKPQPNFLMHGILSTDNIVWDEKNNYTMPSTLYLKRAASKIRLRIKEVRINQQENGVEVNYQMEGMPQIKLMNYNDQTFLLPNNKPLPTATKNTSYAQLEWLKFSDQTNEKNKEKTQEFMALPIPFYSFEKDWSKDASERPYVLVKLMLKAGDKEARPYYYNIPVNFIYPHPEMSEEEKSNLYRLQRNHLYDIVSSINVLGNENEDDPMELNATIAVEPWNEVNIAGDIQNAHYLVVKDKYPLMVNISSTTIDYLSDLDLEEIQISKTWYEYYEDGQLIRFENNGKQINQYIDNKYYNSYASIGFENININNDSKKKTIKIESPIPVNYVPFHIEFTVKQKGTNLKEDVMVTQYPPKYVTGQKSPGFKGGTSEPYADFRYHDYLGNNEQINDVFFKVTTITNTDEELIGDPIGSYDYTPHDAITNRLISPQFIIATQHGMSSPNTPQYNESFKQGWGSFTFSQGYGPRSRSFNEMNPYRPFLSSTDSYKTNQQVYAAYSSARDRCYYYFEGEYGRDGFYTEHYLDKYGYKRSRQIKKTFKYKGRWRMPTSAEVQLIDQIQDDPHSAVKKLLQGNFYWTSELNVAYNFNSNVYSYSHSYAAVRCVFDTYKLKNHP